MRKPLLLMAMATLPAVGCDNGQTNVLGGVPAIAYISRTPADTGNVFDYTGGGKDGNLFTLTPPTASGVKKNLTNWSGGDVNALDLSFDAREIVFSGKAPGDDRYHIFRINVDGTNPCDAAAGKVSQGPCQITMGPNDEVYPIYLPAGRIFYVTNRNVEGGAVPQFRDEYERATTAQSATMKLDGSDQVLGPRNVSHRVAPTLLSDGRILLTEWRHLGDVNEGDLTIMQQDLTGVREGFGREGKGLTNSYLRAKEYAPGQLVVIGTSRDRTYQAGKILRVSLGGADITTQSEARSSAQDLTPLVPADRTPSFKDVGRYYDVAPVPGSTDRFLTTWADGPVETEILSMAKASPDFGIYVYDAKTQTRFPVVNDPNTWEQSPLAIVKRAEPPTLTPLFAAQGTTATLLGAINVYDSTMFPSIAAGSAVKVRITEGFSAEEGFPDMFGLTEFDGQARLGEVPINPDGSFKAQIPANTPVRLQLIDKFGMALATSGPGGNTAAEPVWIQGRSGEARVCGGCHEDRTKAIALAPGSSLLQATGAPDLFTQVPRQDRKSDVFSYDKVMGVPWDKAIQPILTAKCAVCHDGTPGAANPSYSITDVTDMTTFSFTFNLSATPVTIMAGMRVYTYSASYISLLGPQMAFEEKQVMVTGDPKAYIEPGAAHASVAIQMLNPPQRFPTVDLGTRAFPNMPVHPSEVTDYNGHSGADPAYQLTPDEYYLLILSADSGGQYYTRENAPGGVY
jgi:Hydrazine synthase alpha subunit middle domain